MDNLSLLLLICSICLLVVGAMLVKRFWPPQDRYTRDISKHTEVWRKWEKERNEARRESAPKSEAEIRRMERRAVNLPHEERSE